MSSEPARLVRTFIDAWNERAYDRLPELVSDDYALIDPAAPGGAAYGADGAEEWLRTIVEGLPDFEIEILDLVADGGTVAVELRYSGTHRGNFKGVPPTDRRIELKGMEKHCVESGKLVETHVYLDERELREQLGLTFPAVLGQLPGLLLEAWRERL